MKIDLNDIWVLALCQSKWWRANTQYVTFETLSNGQFVLSTQLITLNYPLKG